MECLKRIASCQCSDRKAALVNDSQSPRRVVVVECLPRNSSSHFLVEVVGLGRVVTCIEWAIASLSVFALLVETVARMIIGGLLALLSVTLDCHLLACVRADVWEASTPFCCLAVSSENGHPGHLVGCNGEKGRVLWRLSLLCSLLYREDVCTKSACVYRIPPVQPDPSQPGLLFYRGISASKRAAIAAKYRQGQTIHWSGMSSVTSDVDIARQFAGSNGVLFVITCRSARDVSELSAIPAERESLLLPNFCAMVVQPLQAPQADDELRISVVELLEQLGSEPQVDI
eukprot:4135395-Amphidinium_carterae.1